MTDDGQPDPPGAVTTTWTQVSGPGTVTFADASAEDTTESFSLTGTYVLRLTADDGKLTAFDEVTMTINGRPVAGDDTAITPIATPIDIPVLANDTDDGTLNPATVTVGTPPANGTTTVESGTGVITYTPNPGFNGTDSFTYTVADTAGLVSNEATVTLTVLGAGSTAVIDVRVAASSDDAEERATGSMVLGSSDLELVFDGSDQTVGLRFTGVAIPQRVMILDASVQFQVDETPSGATFLTIEGEATDNAVTFTTATGNISSRSRTAMTVAWAPAPWPTVGEEGLAQQTPNLAAVIQEIVARSGWASGNALVIIITGTGERVAESFNGVPVAAPLLHVEFSN